MYVTNAVVYTNLFFSTVLFDQKGYADALQMFGKASQLQPQILPYKSRTCACLAALGKYQVVIGNIRNNKLIKQGP